MVSRLGVINSTNLHFTGVIKIQLPIVGGGEALVYNQSGSLHMSFPVEDVKDLFGENEYKIYRKCRLQAGTLEVDPQPLQFTPNW